MTVPATAEVPSTYQAPVQLHIAQDLLAEILHLPKGTQIDGAAAEHWAGAKLVLYLRIPGAPEGADQVVPQWEWDAERPDPVRLAELWWLREGARIGTTRGGWD